MIQRSKLHVISIRTKYRTIEFGDTSRDLSTARGESTSLANITTKEAAVAQNVYYPVPITFKSMTT